MTRWVNCYHIWIGYTLSGIWFSKMSILLWAFYFIFVCIFRVFDQIWLLSAFGCLYFLISIVALRNSFQQQGSLAAGLAITREEKVKAGFLAGLGAAAILSFFLFLTLVVTSIPSGWALEVVFKSEQYDFGGSFYLAALLWCILIYLFTFPACVIRTKGIASLFFMASIGVGIGGVSLFPSMMHKIVEQVSNEPLVDGTYRMAELYVYQLPGGWITVVALAAVVIILTWAVLKMSCKFYKTGR